MTRPFDRERKELAPINWRRGLFRLWVLISAAWIMGWLIFYAIEFIGGTWTDRDFLTVPIVLFGPESRLNAGTVTSVTAGDSSISIGGSTAVPTVAVAANGITNSKVADGALTPAKIARSWPE